MRLLASISSGYLKNPMTLVDTGRERTKDLVTELELAMKNKMNQSKGALDLAIGKLDALNPLGVLKRGYTVTECGGNLVKSVSELKGGDEISVRFSDGDVRAIVQ